MTRRYYSATDGRITVYRTSLRQYLSARFTSEVNAQGKARLIGELRFATGRPPGSHPTTEISRQEFLMLCDRKLQRIKEAGRDPQYFTSPQDSWVRNSDL